jgi:hypothetical protein
VAQTGQRIIHLYCGKGNEDDQLGTVSFMHKRIISAVRRV